MLLPSLNVQASTRDTVSAFLGYYRSDTENAGAFIDTENLSGDLYPLMTTRTRRCKLTTLEKPGGLYAKAQLAWAASGRLYYRGEAVAEVSEGEKQFVGMGAYLLVWPDKISYNTATGEVKHLGAKWGAVGNVSFTLARLDGEDYDYYTGSEAPDPAEHLYWLDTGHEAHVLKIWNAAAESWDSVGTTYVKIAAAGLGAAFAAYDAVTIRGCTDEQFNTSMAIYEAGEDYIKVAALIDQNFVQSIEQGQLTVEREIPDMEFLTECNNRVWGCNSEKNEIYACKLGDPSNWNCYMGLADDSYAVSVGSDGAFTGAVTHLGYVLFFKEDCIHKVFGTVPSNFSTSFVNCRGVQKGSEKSLLVVNEMLYYKSRSDVCVYDGSLPTGISEALGRVSYYDAVAGALNGKYYINMRDAAGAWSLFCYDSARGMWYREDDFHAMHFAALDGDLFALDTDGALWCMNGKTYFYEQEQVETEGPLPWRCETGQMGTDDPDAKYIQRLQLRVQMPVGSTFKAEVEYDSAGGWLTLCEMESQVDRCFTVPVNLRRCDHFRLRLSGVGEMKLFSLTKLMQGGSEVK